MMSNNNKGMWSLMTLGAVILGGYLVFKFYPEAARTVKMHSM